ncbi:MAG TPA: 3-deoxy-7-phosphoheptulonate synthase [Phaeodactylibacter sp.]|nr:3-deoxy-7-phosphoheptulonate synthase [Phaeodactylibacter sp.]
MQFKPLVEKKEGQPIIIAGPCSAETEAQVLETAHGLKNQNIDFFRAGIWKPRTRPNSFEGVGKEGLKWLKKVKEETGLKVTTEVAKSAHVYECLKHGIDLLWIGARTTVSPFAVQEIADAMEGVDVPVLIKNPINPDLNLWIGAIERIYNAGIHRVGVIHRGFSLAGKSEYRNEPLWQIPIELKRRFPDLTIICDNSHICGNREMLAGVAQKAFDLSFHGLMTETHPTPDEAWSDAKQQITPQAFKELIGHLVIKQEELKGEDLESIAALRVKIDVIDDELLKILGERMQIAEAIGLYKKSKNISILQPVRWNEILEKAIAKGREKGLSEKFVTQLLKSIHQESINHQMNVAGG